jgi:hypothetical protein
MPLSQFLPAIAITSLLPLLFMIIHFFSLPLDTNICLAPPLLQIISLP